jgi:hypothetical protein
MSIVPHHRRACHGDFATTPLGLWASQTDLGRLTPGGRHIKNRTGLPAAIANLYAEINGLGREPSR